MQGSEERQREPGCGAPERISAADSADALGSAVLSYLEEIDGYQQVCLRHEPTTAVYASPLALRLVKSFPWTPAAAEYLRRAVEALPGWEETLLWKAWAEDCVALEKAFSDKNVSGGDVATRGIAWEDKPVLVRARSRNDKPLLTVDLVLPSVRGVLPELPLRRAACCLLCHEHLLPEAIARPLPGSTADQSEACTLREFVLRATPHNLYAGKCFSPGGAER